jgi:tetratricopeptide (TPR) repeat protein
VHKTRQLALFVSLITLFMVFFLVNGCVTPAPKELTPEQLQAIQDSIMQVKKDSLNLLWSLGYEHYKQKNYAKAKPYFRKIAFMDFIGLKDRRLEKVYSYLGTCYMQQKPEADPDSAEWAHLRGIDQLPDYPYNYEILEYIYATRGDYEKAIEMATALTGLVPDTALYWVKLSDDYMAIDNCDEALAAIRQASTIDPQNKDILQKMSERQKDCGVDTDEIIKSLEELVKQEPDNIRHHIDLARNYMEILEFRKAANHLESAIALEPENVNALDMLGNCYQEIGQYSKAVDAYQKILLMNPDDIGALCNMAVAYSSMGNYTSALSKVQKAQSIDPEYGWVFITKGMIYEAAADKCSNASGKMSFDDKLTYELAFKEYQKATKDIRTRSEANRRIGYVRPLIPTKADVFMHKNQVRPEGPCYEWIP